MSEASKCWNLFGKSFVMALEETGKAIAESTHEGFQWLAEKTDPSQPVAAPTTEAQIVAMPAVEVVPAVQTDTQLVTDLSKQ